MNEFEIFISELRRMGVPESTIKRAKFNAFHTVEKIADIVKSPLLRADNGHYVGLDREIERKLCS
jgi:hypothetical protein